MTEHGRDKAVPPRLSRDDWQGLEPFIDQLLDAPPGERAALLLTLGVRDPARLAALERFNAECDQPSPLLDATAADHFAALFHDDAPPIPELLAGRYRILREAGHGGMAVVYVARDLKHARDVAIKVVRPELTALLGQARFLREIEIAAQLRHPNVVPLYDSGEIRAVSHGDPEGSSIRYYVMPYEAGHSLRERFERDGPLSVEDVLPILRDVCEALAHAHDHGVVHLDIKPDNVLLSGRHALVTDFGVARVVSEARTEATRTLGSGALGTRAYMAPEQSANAASVDHRADIYALGVMAYELLTGAPPTIDASGPVSEAGAGVAAALVRERPEVPKSLAMVIAKCLALQPENRWQSADALLDRLVSISRGDSVSGPTSVRDRRRKSALVVAGVTLAAIGLVVVAIDTARNAVRFPPLVLGRAVQLTSDAGLEVQPALSPDGRRVAYATGRSLQMHIVVRPVAGGRPIPLTADTTENQWLPRWSRDGTRILYLASGGVSSVPASGGASRVDVPGRPGIIVTSATWSPDGREIAYVRADSLLAHAVGGATRLITTGRDLHSCSWSPNGRQLACVSGNSFYVSVGSIFGLGPMFGNLAPSRIVLIPSAGGRSVSVTDSSSLHQSPVWSRDGATLYYVSNRDGPRDLYALRVDRPARGEPVRVTTGMGIQSLDLAADGRRVVYAVYASTANIWSLAIPRAHTVSAASAVPLTTGNQTVEGIRVSPDRRWLVFDSDLSGTSQVYRMPIGGGDAERLTRGPADAFRGVLSPSGKELVYHSYQTGSRNLFLLPLAGGPVQQLTQSSSQRSMANWSPDGNALALFDMNSAQVFVMRRDSDGRWSAPRFIGGPGVRPEWSTDGRTIAFVSPRDGRISIARSDSGEQRDLYVPHAGDPLAELAIYSADGRDVYFKSHDAHGRASFWSIPTTGGRPRCLVRFEDPAHASNRFEFASDGKRLYFTIEDRQSDIWVAQTATH